MSMSRRIEPEWLDELPADDRRALRSRRDLKRVNCWMLQAGIMARSMSSACQGRKPRTILDLGAGDGSFTLAVARRLARRWPGVKVTLLDRQSIVAEETQDGFRALGWEAESVSADLFDFLAAARSPRADIVTANLFLHHLKPVQIARLFAAAAAAPGAFVACEPRRGRFALTASRLLWAIGCNDVTRHDAVVSVRAGFRDRELSLLWPDAGAWQLTEGPALPFTHCFRASPMNGVRP